MARESMHLVYNAYTQKFLLFRDEPTAEHYHEINRNAGHMTAVVCVEIFDSVEDATEHYKLPEVAVPTVTSARRTPAPASHPMSRSENRSTLSARNVMKSLDYASLVDELGGENE